MDGIEQNTSARLAVLYYIKQENETAFNVAEKYGVSMPDFWADYKQYKATISSKK